MRCCHSSTGRFAGSQQTKPYAWNGAMTSFFAQ
jgi:hypothetical protein